MCNTGGVACGFNIGDTSVLFITAHFQAHQHNVVGRNADFMKINSKLEMRQPSTTEKISDKMQHMMHGVKEKALSKGSEHAQEPCSHASSPYVADRYEHCFWSGDLNYRVHANRKMADALLQRGMYDVMMANDQLAHERARHRVFAGFVEGNISFPPTYKFDSNSDAYDTSKKQRVPSWTDRILYKPSNAIELIKYDSVRTIRTSDHRPVYATFRLRVQLPRPANAPQIATTQMHDGGVFGQQQSQAPVTSQQPPIPAHPIDHPTLNAPSNVCVIQ